MSTPPTFPANRILVIDDNPAIHEDFRKILAAPLSSDSELKKTESFLFGHDTPADLEINYQIDSALQGQDGLRLVEQAGQEGRPYALAFVDLRMPPGWDGVETIARIWQSFPELQVVICTAYSDYSWSEMMSRLGHSDNLVILKKPFDTIEVLQLAHSLTRKWMLGQQVKAHIRHLDELVQTRTHNLQETNEALRRSEERFAKSFRASPVPLALLSVGDQRYVDVNNSFLEGAGFRREEVLGHTAAELQLFPQPELLPRILTALSEKRPVQNLQGEMLSRDGRKLTVLISAEAIELEGCPHFLMLIQDITERLNIENQLRQAQKMEAVGQIAAGVAHDFNNILTVIQGHAELQSSAGHKDESLAESLQEISRAATRAAALTRQLLAFSRKQMLQRRPLDLRELVNNLEKMLRRIIGENIHLRIHCAENLPLVFADPVNIEQIIINLAVNARDAMPRGGPLTVAVQPVQVDAAYKERMPDSIIGAFVRLSVADEGDGMDATVRAKIFEPFFTTKDVGKGTGMGLATVYGIVKQHQGWIEVESEPGSGSVFKVYLPLCDEPLHPSANLDSDLAQINSLHSRTILFVEDETPLRAVSSTILKRLGYEVLAARDGNTALNLWQQHRGKIDLLLTDMVMPGNVSGLELADQILHEEPGMRVIYSTGYSVDLFGSGIKLVEGVNCLLKPYDASALARTVRKAFAKAA